MRGCTSTVFGKYKLRGRLVRGDTHVEAGVHGDCCVQISDDTLESTSSREVREERRVLPMQGTGQDDVLEVICNILNALPLGWWSI